MKIVRTKSELGQIIGQEKAIGKKIGFVPTMGALHAGHLSLIEVAQKRSDFVVCSIFVNPTQFNDPLDLEKYPRPVERDIQLLESGSCALLFLPGVEEMYGPQEIWNFDLGQLEEIFEGAMRPGHFQGVTQIVYKLFNAVDPDIVFFGQKDLQQCKVIEYMIRQFDMPIKLIICPIIREEEGLAMSSRNIRLSPEGRRHALALSRSLHLTFEAFKEGRQLVELERSAIEYLRASPGIELEYFAIVDAFELEKVDRFDDKGQYVALVAAWVNGIRLLDNMFLN